MTAPVLSSIFLAQDAAAPTGPASILSNPMIFPILMIVMMYFLLIRPQRKKQQEQEALQKAAKAGDQVVTIGGVHGKITKVNEKTLMVQVADGVRVEYDKSAIATVVKRGEEAPASAANGK